jgi:2-polyprenyl-3-methyl-5-hydroxy-6-metoxy-1,4-benzoquinol methylase
MKTSSHDLDEWRKFAAAKTHGPSDEACHALAWRMAVDEKPLGRVLEFGAGSGAFARGLHETKLFESIVCADILSRPGDLSSEIRWIQADLNYPLSEPDGFFDTILSIEVIEHLENPRAVFREFHRLLGPGGRLILTTPNQESLRSYAGLVLGGHFAAFLGASYPAHITALMRKDLERICAETGFGNPRFAYSGEGRIPKLTMWRWQKFLPFLRGRIFSDNFGMLAQK